MRKSLLYAAALICAASLLTACKPTEKNYRLAYEKAQEKAHQGLTDEEYRMMTLNDLPSYMRTATDSIRGFRESVIWQYTPAAVDSGRKAVAAHYNLAVGKYSMLTNAKAHADRLAADGWQARVFRNGEPVYYVVAKMSDNLDSIAHAGHIYSARYPKGTVALHEPMAIVAY